MQMNEAGLIVLLNTATWAKKINWKNISRNPEGNPKSLKQTNVAWMVSSEMYHSQLRRFIGKRISVRSPEKFNTFLMNETS
jgi:hypothetical protein